MAGGLLSGVRVLEVAGQVSAAYCGKILALLGAEVIKVEPPAGDTTRRAGPFPGDLPHPEKSGLFLALNVNKFGITLDPALPADRRRLRTLARSAAVVVSDGADRATGSEALRRENPGLVVTAISPFGNWGPCAGFKASDLVLFHMSGQAPGMLGAVADGDAQPPIRAGGHQAEFVTGLAAATATLMALFRHRQTGQGARVDVSGFEAMATQLISALANCAFDQPPPARVAAPAVVSVGGVLPCRDGYVAVSPREDAQWAHWVDLMGNPAWADEERFRTREGRERHFAELWELAGRWTRRHGKHDIARRAQEQRIPCFPVNTVRDLFNDDHLRFRGFFREIEHPVAGRLSYAGAPYRLSHLTLPVAARPAPLLGEHNTSILGRFAPAASAPRPAAGDTRTERGARPAAPGRRQGGRPQLDHRRPDGGALSGHDGRRRHQGRQRQAPGPVDARRPVPGVQPVEAVLQPESCQARRAAPRQTADRHKRRGDRELRGRRHRAPGAGVRGAAAGQGRYRHGVVIRHRTQRPGQGLRGLRQPAAILYGVEFHLGLPGTARRSRAACGPTRGSASSWPW